MYDPGLRSYQDIREPEYVTDDRPTLYEWVKERDRFLATIFEHTLFLSRALNIHLFFEWSPHVNGVYISTFGEDATWHSGQDNKAEFIINGDCVDPDMDPADWAARIISRLDDWADDFEEGTH